MRTAILLIAHGSRQTEANDDTYWAARELSKCSDFAHVQPAFLELTEPDIDSGAETCVARGAERVVLLPYFLSPGRHARMDLEAARQRLSDRHDGVTFLLAAPLGPHEKLVEILHERATHTLDALSEG
jgi:sirohydrochlorin ferrochelatase